ncbi:MAG: stage V sporulation protein D [Bacillota bacterium]|nr:stage V sporulation protein D [Bacillota bacterium]MDD3297546.1 stage V sporulation protein D [Bacillota bacterium]MDD3850206.1 stage V sporulation protein D [Bacillota bacterium]MDD4707251.1 stage V sporulation protein D [Bacillota bacterium]
MTAPSIRLKKRLIFCLFAFFFLFFALILRLAWIQIIRGDTYRDMAVDQWTRDIPVPSKRGIIYDRNGKKLAISASIETLYVRPVEIKSSEEVSYRIAEALDMDREDVLDRLTRNVDTVLLKKKVEKEDVDRIRDIEGIYPVDDSKRYYPNRNFASHILGFTGTDNQGLDGVEALFDRYLYGLPGRNIAETDAAGRRIPFGFDTQYSPQDGYHLVLTIDEVIQHFAEKAIDEAVINNKAKRGAAIVMDPKTGDILSLVVKPDYDPNTPFDPINEQEQELWEGLSAEELRDERLKMWRNYAVSDIYEPGSTFKIITTAAGLEEGVVRPDSTFYCKGSIMVGGRNLKCWRSYNPHGHQTFVEAAQNSCNPVFIEVAQRLGKEKFLEYIEAFGFGEPTGVDLPGEAYGLVMNPSVAGPVELANMGFGQGVAVTPIQLAAAASAIANEGMLMEPKIALALKDQEGNTIHEFEPKLRRQVISPQTARTEMQILETVVSEGTGSNAYVPGFRVAGKTGTAQKVVDGRYVQGKYVASFLGIAPADDPRVVVLVVIDEPDPANYYGGQIAAPVVGNILSDTLRYLKVQPRYTEEEAERLIQEKVEVPDVGGIPLKEAIKTLNSSNLQYQVVGSVIEGDDNRVVDQTPKPDIMVSEKSIVLLYLESYKGQNQEAIVPNVIGKTVNGATGLLRAEGLKVQISGTGIAVDQEPLPGEVVNIETIVKVIFEEPEYFQ